MWDKIKSMLRDPAVLFGLVLVVLLIVALGVLAQTRNRRISNCREYEQKANAAYEDQNYADANLYYQTFLFGPDKCDPGDKYEEYLARRDESSDYNSLLGEPIDGDFRFEAKRLIGYLSDSRNDTFREAVEARIAEVYQLWSADPSEGHDLMREIYDVICEGTESEVLQTTDLADPAREPRYWYPQPVADDSQKPQSPYMASTADEFRVAVCAEAIHTTVIQTCTYAPGGNALAGGTFSSAVRKAATYKLVLKDTKTGNPLEEYEPVMSLPAGGCPLSMSPGVFDEIIGEPDYDSARDWIEDQLRALQ